MPKYGYLVLEGPHDIEFVCRLLKPHGFKRVQWEADLDDYLRQLIPRAFPHNGDLLKRVPVPTFLKSTSHVIALHNAIGDSRLVNALEESRTTINLSSDFNTMTGVGVILDSDKAVPARDRYNAIAAGLRDKGFELPATPGTIAPGPPRLGAFVLPDNASDGNLEDLLLECASMAYPDLLKSASVHVDAAKADPSLRGDGEDLSKTPVFNKAVAGTIASVLRPGKAIQTSIQDNKWAAGSTLEIPRVKAVRNFLAELFDLT